MKRLIPWRPENDVVHIGGRPLPGAARVSVTLPDCLDRQKPRGAKKSRTRDDGDKPAEIEIELELLAGQYPALKSFIPMLRPRGKTEPKNPLKIVHPKCAMWGIDVVTIGQISDPAPRNGGTLVLKIKAFEWTPEPSPVKAMAKKPEDSSDADNGGWNIPLQQLPPSMSPNRTP